MSTSTAVAEAAKLVVFPITATVIGAVAAGFRRLSDAASGFVQHFAAARSSPP